MFPARESGPSSPAISTARSRASLCNGLPCIFATAANVREDFDSLRSTQAVLASLAPVKAPADLALRLRVAISNERARTPEQSLACAEGALGEYDCAVAVAGLGWLCQYRIAGGHGSAADRDVCPAGTVGGAGCSAGHGVQSSLSLLCGRTGGCSHRRAGQSR